MALPKATIVHVHPLIFALRGALPAIKPSPHQLARSRDTAWES
jgi:hypothetical protein